MTTKTQTHCQSPVRFTLIKSGLLALGLICGLAASAQTMTTTTNFTVGTAVPDDVMSGVASAQNISTPISYISGLKVSLKMSGTWNGDLFCYLTHSSGYTVLLNRVGRTSSNSLGYSDQGFNVTFDDAAANGDIHVYRTTLNGNDSTPITGALTNVWAPDARTNDPAAALDINPRTAFLSSFNGLNPNGQWVLFVADMEAGDLCTLDSWGLEITGYTPPSIALQPANTTAECSTGTASFSVSASGSGPLALQWRFNGSPISGATTSVLTLSNPAFAQAGDYDVVITNSYGTITSAAASLTVQDTTPPSITCPAAITATTDPGQCFASGVNLGTPVAADSCGSVTLANNAPAQFPVGTTTVTWTATDEHNNVNSCTQTVTVTDTQAPVVTCPANITVFTTNTAGTIVTFTPTATDNCGVQSVVATPASGSTFPVGTNQVSVTATDIHGNTSQCSFTVVVLLDHAPVAGNINLGAVENYPRYLLTAKVLGHCSDTDGNPLTVVSVSPNSTNGGTVTLTATDIIYTSATNFIGNDLFTYTISDGLGGFATGSVFVQVTSSSAPSFNKIGTLNITSGGVVVTFAGVPGYTYTLERSTSLSQPDWTAIGTFVVGDNGIANYTDTNPPQGAAYYRTVSQ